jgi:large subunit ribosomal protein L21
MTYAIIEIAGSQLRVEPGRYYEINYLGGEAGDAYSNDRVLLVNHNDDVSVGQPLVNGALVEGEILSHKRGKKVIVYKMQPKKKTRKKRGHRQELTRLLIKSIKVNGETLAESAQLSSEQIKEAEVTA